MAGLPFSLNGLQILSDEDMLGILHGVPEAPSMSDIDASAVSRTRIASQGGSIP